jgi:hypothetical protein
MIAIKNINIDDLDVWRNVDVDKLSAVEIGEHILDMRNTLNEGIIEKF